MVKVKKHLGGVIKGEEKAEKVVRCLCGEEETTNKARTKRLHCCSRSCKVVIFLPAVPGLQKHHCKLLLTPALCFASLLELGNLPFFLFGLEVTYTGMYRLFTLIDALFQFLVDDTHTFLFFSPLKQMVNPKPAAPSSLCARTR